jgi:hypothetical protein
VRAHSANWDAEITEIRAIAEAVAAKTLTLDNSVAWPEIDRLSQRLAGEAAGLPLRGTSVVVA